MRRFLLLIGIVQGISVFGFQGEFVKEAYVKRHLTINNSSVLILNDGSFWGVYPLEEDQCEAQTFIKVFQMDSKAESPHQKDQLFMLTDSSSHPIALGSPLSRSIFPIKFYEQTPLECMNIDTIFHFDDSHVLIMKDGTCFQVFPVKEDPEDTLYDMWFDWLIKEVLPGPESCFLFDHHTWKKGLLLNVYPLDLKDVGNVKRYHQQAVEKCSYILGDLDHNRFAFAKSVAFEELDNKKAKEIALYYGNQARDLTKFIPKKEVLDKNEAIKKKIEGYLAYHYPNFAGAIVVSKEGKRINLPSYRSLHVPEAPLHEAPMTRLLVAVSILKMQELIKSFELDQPVTRYLSLRHLPEGFYDIDDQLRKVEQYLEILQENRRTAFATIKQKFLDKQIASAMKRIADLTAQKDWSLLTVRELLHALAGRLCQPRLADYLNPLECHFQKLHGVMTEETIIESFKNLALISTAGPSQNSACALLKAVIEDVTGSPYEDFFARIFQMADMHHTQLMRGHQRHELSSLYHEQFVSGELWMSLEDCGKLLDGIFTYKILGEQSTEILKDLMEELSEEKDQREMAIQGDKGIGHSGLLPCLANFTLCFEKKGISIVVITDEHTPHDRIAFDIGEIIFNELSITH